MYKLQIDKNGNFSSIEYTNQSGQIWSVPIDPDNTDYQAYLAWVAEGNEPLPADEA